MLLFDAFVVLFLVLWALYAAVLPTLLRSLHAVGKRGAALSIRWGIVQRVVKRASKFRDYLPVAAILVAGALLAVWAGDGFLDLAEQVHTQSTTLQQIDHDIHSWAVTRRNIDATTFFVTMTTIGGPAGIAGITLATLIALVIRHRYRWAIYLASNVIGGGLLDLELKRYFARARPDIAEMLRRASGYSFPSGHSMGAAILFSSLSYLAIRAFPRWRYKSAALALATTLIASVALSRVYLGVHWISDVGAGVTAGLLWTTMTTVAYETSRRIRLLRRMRARSLPLSPSRGEGDT